MSVTLREALPADAAVVTEFNRLLALETEHKQLEPNLLAAGVAAVLRDRTKGVYYLAEQAGEIVGQLLITTEWSDWRNGWFWWIQSVYVREEARKRGIFKLLYEHVHKIAQAHGNVVGLRLYVECDNERAQKVYARLGMTPTGYLLLEHCPL